MRSTLKKYWAIHGIPLLLSVPLGLLAVGATHYASWLPGFYNGFLNRQRPEFIYTFTTEGIPALIMTLSVACGLAALFWMTGFIIGFFRKSWALSWLRAGYGAVYLLALLYIFGVFRVTGLIFEKALTPTGFTTPNAVQVFFWRYDLIWPVILLAGAIAVLHVISWQRRTLDVYTLYHAEETAAGDRILENLRTHGKDPQFRKSIFHSMLLHFCVIILIPWLVRGCVEPYQIPEGSGNPVIGYVKLVKPKKKPQKRLLLNPKSAISFHIPTVDESELEKEVEETTQLTHVAEASSVHKLGAGGGKRGGWPGGMKNAIVRFIRLEYDGENWNDGMDPSTRADMNFLDEFKKATGFKVASNGESHPIRLLDDYPKGFAPPFVYMTGSGQINVSPKDIEIMRKYLLDGGMLFADCGGAPWDRSFRAFIQAVFPGEPLLVISKDDPIYQTPNVFADGAPALWHHGGFHTLGIKRGRRWVVYYHPGDMNDAWKIGHSGMSLEMTQQAYQLGINIVYHAFTHYLEATRKYRK